MKPYLFEEQAKYKYNCVYLPLKISSDNWNHFLKTFVKPEHIYQPEGLEYDPHVTLLYGIDPAVSATDDRLQKILNAFPIPLKFSSTLIDFFENDQYDVIKFNINGNAGSLYTGYKALKKLIPNYNKYPTYYPHVTIAYLHRGMGKLYYKKLIQPVEFQADSIVYSMTNDTKIIIK